MSKKVPFNPKEIMAAETSAVSLTFKKLEEKLDEPFEDDESESSNESSEEGSEESNVKKETVSRVSEEPKVLIMLLGQW